MTSKRLQLTERDEAGNITATYVQSSSGDDETKTRIDVIPPRDGKSSAQKLLDVFMPAGYPHSVTGDYLE